MQLIDYIYSIHQWWLSPWMINTEFDSLNIPLYTATVSEMFLFNFHCFDAKHIWSVFGAPVEI